MSTTHAEAQDRYRAGDLAGAKALFETALTAEPGNWALLHDLGLLLRQLGDRPASERHVLRALVLAPDASLGWTTIGLLAGDAGAFPQARTAIDRARLIAPDEPASLIARTELAKPDEVPAYAARIRAMAQRPDLPTRQRARLLHALGKLFDRADDVDRAFAAVTAAHAMRRRERPYDPEEDSAFFASLTATCDAAWWARPGSGSAVAVRPVFIVGMPRSGTTLLEQMLSRHPDVDAGGECLALQAVLAVELPQRLGSDFPACLAAAAPGDWSWAANRYLELTADRRRCAVVFTDKLPANFLLVGPILRMFPDARILHMVRDPLDTGLSCYLTDFAHGQSFAGDLDFLGHHLRLYLSLMEHWRSLGSTGLLDVAYEELVVEPETALRRVLEHCGLNWHGDCLAFGAARHAANTASWRRVRGGLDRRRIGRWRRYGHLLGRLVGRLSSPTPAADDIRRRTLTWEPDLGPETLAAAEAALAATTPQAAARMLARMPAVARRDAGLLSAAATAAVRAGNPHLARRLLAAAVRVAPSSPAIHINLAVAEGRAGEAGAAVRSLRRALALRPGMPEAWSNLGNFLTPSDLPRALAAHGRAVTAAPAVPGFHGNLGQALLRQADGVQPAWRAYRRRAILVPADRLAGMQLYRVAGGAVDTAAGLLQLDRLRCAHPLDGEVLYERGCALREAGRDAEAADSLRRAVVLEPQHGTWRHVLDALGGRTGRGAAAGYAKELFDQYADAFDRHLTEGLRYRTPQALTDAIARFRPGLRALGTVLDLGCGTGLMGAALRERFALEHLTGVDVSGAMLDRLRERGGYDAASEADLHDFLEGGTARYDLIVAADVLVYLGPLERFMAAAAGALASGGTIALSVEESDGPPFKLRRSGRYAHARDYLAATAAAAGLRLAHCETADLREEHGQPVSGLLALLVAAAG